MIQQSLCAMVLLTFLALSAPAAGAVDVGPCSPSAEACGSGNCTGVTMTISYKKLTSVSGKVTVTSQYGIGFTATFANVASFQGDSVTNDITTPSGDCVIIASPCGGGTWGGVMSCDDICSECRNGS